VQALETRVAQLEADKATGQQQFASLEARLTAIETTRGGVVPANLDWLWALGGGMVFAGTALGAWQLRRRQALRKEPV
jgi:hypothetical protein